MGLQQQCVNKDHFTKPLASEHPDSRGVAENEELRRQWRNFDAVLSNIPDHAFILDSSLRLLYVNRALSSTWQMSHKEMVGKTLTELIFPPELVAATRRDVQLAISSRLAVQAETTFEDARGQTVTFEHVFTPILESDEAVQAVAGISRDISSRKLAEEERERQEQSREAARLESLGVMAGGIAHDFNNLLTGILGNASLLTEIVPARERAIANSIVLAAERACEVTKQMLAYSGRGHFVLEILDLNQLIGKHLPLLQASVSRNVHVDLQLDCTTCVIKADLAQIQQIVVNLLANASDAIGERAGAITIRTAEIERSTARFNAQLRVIVPAGRYVLLEIRDNGGGMAPETLKRIFDPFFTTKFAGRGLGLAAVLGIVKGHGGDIEVESRLGAGATFRIYLPLSAHADFQKGKSSSDASSRAADKVVLVVDDEEIVRDTTCIALERKGFRVITASNGAEALEILRGEPGISLVLLDLMMPVMTGEQAVPLIHAIRPSVPILLSSGFGEGEMSRRFASSGVAGFLQKPYRASDIWTKVTAALGI